jgi:hypothetical protein
MDVEVLKEVLRFERDPREESFSSSLPFRHAEIAREILAACRAGGDELPDADKIQLLLEDISTVRMDKIRRNVHTLSSQLLSQPTKEQPIIVVTGMGSLEMHAVKSFVTDSFRLHRELTGKGSGYSPPLQGAGEGREGLPSSGSAGEGATRGSGRLRASRLVRENENREEDLEEPRPLEEIEAEEEKDDDDNDDDEGGEEVGRSKIRRHR